jgi:hypothetical protein
MNVIRLAAYFRGPVTPLTHSPNDSERLCQEMKDGDNIHRRYQRT